MTTKFITCYLKHFYFNSKNLLIYNSGRAMHSYLKAKEENNLIVPNYFISRCGVEIYENNKGQFI